MAVASFPTLLAAQTEARPPKTLCLRGRPLPACQSFWLFETGGNGRAYTTHRVPGGEQVNVAENGNGYAAVDIGFMVNRPGGTAVGGSFEIGAEDASRRRLALEARKRVWLPSGLAFDAGAGVLEINTRKKFRPFANGAGYGVTSHAGLVFGDILTLTTSVDVVRGQRTQLTLLFGGRLGSYPAAGLTLLVALLASTYHDQS